MSVAFYTNLGSRSCACVNDCVHCRASVGFAFADPLTNKHDASDEEAPSAPKRVMLYDDDDDDDDKALRQGERSGEAGHERSQAHVNMMRGSMH